MQKKRGVTFSTVRRIVKMVPMYQMIKKSSALTTRALLSLVIEMRDYNATLIAEDVHCSK